MKISEIKTFIKEEVDQEVLQKLKNAIRVYAQMAPTSSKDQSKQDNNQNQTSTSDYRQQIRTLVTKIKSGEHNSVKQLDTLIKTRPPQYIRSFIINTGNQFAEAITSNADINSRMKTAVRKKISLQLTGAFTGYANKKYLGGSADNFKTGKGFWDKVKQAAGAAQTNSSQPQQNQQQQSKPQQNQQQQSKPQQNQQQQSKPD